MYFSGVPRHCIDYPEIMDEFHDVGYLTETHPAGPLCREDFSHWDYSSWGLLVVGIIGSGIFRTKDYSH